MTKKVFNRFDPFMPAGVNKINADHITENLTEKSVENFSTDILSENFSFSTPRVKKGFTIVITKQFIGTSNEIGKKLLEDFIYSLSNSFELPQYLIFMNEAVLLLENEKVNSLLFQLKKYGVKNLVSLETVEYFKCNINNKIIMQATSGDITEKILFSEKLINM